MMRRSIWMRVSGGRYRCALMALGAAIGVSAQAAGQATAAGSAAPTAPDAAGMLAAFAAVLALIPLVLWAWRRMAAPRNTVHAPLHIAAQLSLGPRERLVAVDTGDRWLLLAISPAGVQRVGSMARPEQGSLSGPIATPGRALVDFPAVLRNLRRPPSSGGQE